MSADNRWHRSESKETISNKAFRNRAKRRHSPHLSPPLVRPTSHWSLERGSKGSVCAHRTTCLPSRELLMSISQRARRQPRPVASLPCHLRRSIESQSRPHPTWLDILAPPTDLWRPKECRARARDSCPWQFPRRPAVLEPSLFLPSG